MKNLVFLFTLLISTFSFAGEIAIEINPPEAIKGEPFNVTFSITSEDGSDPDISFNPLGVEVISRNQTGVSTRTTYINGKLSVERKITVEYEMVSNALSYAYLRDIQVVIGGKTLKHPTKTIRVLSQPRQNLDIFALAVVDKSELFVNQSLLVRYYLYNKIPISSYDIKKFPQLNKFLKRFHQERVNAERVEYRGEIYTRRVIYTAQVYAEKAGKYKIDPITLFVQYPYRRSDPFGSLGMGLSLRSMRNKTVRSKLIEIEAKSLPTEGVPPHFTGLVGKHDFKLKLNKSKFLVNEPVEVKFSVTGPGALEIFDAPKLLSHPSLEAFESNSDLKVEENFIASKSFDMTYLGRESLEIEAEKIPLSYFDPKLMKFVTVELSIEGVKVIGEAITRSGENKTEVKPEQKVEPSVTVLPTVDNQKVLIPIYKLVNTYRYQSTKINAILIAVIFLLIGFKLKTYWSERSYIDISPVDVIKKQGVTYSNLHGLITLLDQGQGQNMVELIESSPLSKKAKAYFVKLIVERENEYKSGVKLKKKAINKKYLSEFVKVIKSKNEPS